MEPEGNFERRVCAVLLADVKGFSKLMGEDDERTARAVAHFQSLAKGIIDDANGRAEAVAGDALFATFDSVVAAVTAALNVQRRLATEDLGTPLTVRMGVHVGDVLLREGRAFGDAINIAARLESLARPGTVCISDTVYRQVRNKFDDQFVDLGMQRLKNISDPLHAYLVIPRETAAMHGPASRRRPPRWLLAAGGVSALAALAAGVWFGLPGPPKAQRPGAATPGGMAGKPAPVGEKAVPVEGAEEEQAQVALGVMLFKTAAGGEQDWRREALRDGLNAQLSRLSQVKVYSKEFLDFLVTRKGLSEIEAATQLGIKKMLSGSLVEKDGVLHIETHVVDVSSGVLELSYTTTGSAKDFVGLQNQVTLEVISRLNLPVTESEKQILVAERNTNADALKLLLEAEGGAQRPEPRSSLPLSQRLAGLLAPAAAFADESEVAIKNVLEAYRKATEARQIDDMAKFFAEFSEEQRAAQERYFEGVRDLKVVIDNVDIAVVGDEAVVSYTRTDDFADARTGRPMHVSVRLTKTLRLENGAWKLAGAK